MTETEPTVHPGTLPEEAYGITPAVAAAALHPCCWVFRLAPDGETPDLTPSETVAGGVFHMATWSLDSDPATVLAEAARDALAIDAHRAEAARKAEAPHVEVTDDDMSAIVGKAIDAALCDGTSLREVVTTAIRVALSAAKHREPATPEPGPDPRRPDLREGMVVDEEPPRGWEVAVDPGAGNLMHGAKGWSSERLGAGGVPWIDMRCTYERLTLVAFHPEHAGLDPEPSPMRDVQVGDRVFADGKPGTVEIVEADELPYFVRHPGGPADWYSTVTHLYAPGEVIESAHTPEPGPTTVLRNGNADRFWQKTGDLWGWNNGSGSLLFGMRSWRAMWDFPMTVEII